MGQIKGLIISKLGYSRGAAGTKTYHRVMAEPFGFAFGCASPGLSPLERRAEQKRGIEAVRTAMEIIIDRQGAGATNG